MPMPPPMPPAELAAATGATPPITAALAPGSTETGEVLPPPTILASNGVWGLPPPEPPGRPAALTIPAPLLGPEPPAAGWFENDENGLTPPPVPLPPEPNCETSCCSGCAICCNGCESCCGIWPAICGIWPSICGSWLISCIIESAPFWAACCACAVGG